MNIGLALLYAAFAVVALWLLGEVLLQHRAPAQWRALALLGFLGLVAGVHQGSAVIVGVGVLAFGAGQGLVTRSVKRGDGPHWSLRGADGALPGPLGGLPLLARAFPAAEVPESAAAANPALRVGVVGPVEESAAPVLARAEPTAEFVESQPYDGEPDEPGGAYGSGVGAYGSGYGGGAYGAQPPQQTAQPYPQEYQQQPYAYPYQEAVPEGYAPGYEGGQYQQGQQNQQPYPQEYADQYAQEYARQYAAQYGQQPYPQQGYYQQPAPDDYDAVGYDPQGTYQGGYPYDHQAPGQPEQQDQQQQPPQSPPEPWTYG
jgi:hypothetical protein